jgi:hypothetical protein
MVRGLFPRTEQHAVLATLEPSVVFLTSANIERLLPGCSFDSSAWTLANPHLANHGAELLVENAQSFTRQPTFSTTASAPPWASPRHERRSGCSTSGGQPRHPGRWPGLAYLSLVQLVPVQRPDV